MIRTLDKFERAARDRWYGNAARVHYGRCEGCRRVRDDEDKPLLVARQPRARLFLCLECFEFGPPTGGPDQGDSPERTS